MNRIFLFGALALFIAGSVIAFSRLEIQIGDIHWAYLLAISVLAVPSLIASAVEYRVSGLIAGKKVAFADALRVSLYATAANILPLPAGAAVRVQSLRSEGARSGTALAATAVMAFVWLGLALVGAGSFLVPDRPALAAGFLVVGGLALAGAGFGLHRSPMRAGVHDDQVSYGLLARFTPEAFEHAWQAVVEYLEAGPPRGALDRLLGEKIDVTSWRISFCEEHFMDDPVEYEN